MAKYIKIKTVLIVLLGILFATNIIFAQQETVGFEFNQQYRHIDSLNTASSIWSMNYRKELPTSTRISLALGLDNVKFFEDDETNATILKSSNQLFAQAEVLQVLYYLYLKGAIQFYTIKGNTYKVTSSYSEVKYHNNYNIFEFPLSLGFTVPTKYIDVFVGVNKTYFYGSNKKEIFVNNTGTETSLGTEPRQTFKTDLDIGIEGSLIYHASENMDIELNAIKYSEKDFSIKLSIWGPLQFMH